MARGCPLRFQQGSVNGDNGADAVHLVPGNLEDGHFRKRTHLRRVGSNTSLHGGLAGSFLVLRFAASEDQ